MEVVRWPSYRLAGVVEKGSVARASAVCTHSRFTAEQVRDLYGRTASICHYGIDTDVYRPRPEQSKENVVLSVGAIAWVKGHEEVIRILAKIPAVDRPLLKVIGQVANASEVHHLRELASRLAVPLEIMLDKLSRDELVREYCRARLLVCMAYREPFGLTPLECMACGTPVVAADEGGFCETVQNGETGFLVRRGSAEAVEAVHELLTNSARNAQMGAAGVSYVGAQWRWTQGVNEFERILFGSDT
jgi:glycosyltransferase involved in cell wall biosynthesis